METGRGKNLQAPQEERNYNGGKEKLSRKAENPESRDKRYPFSKDH